MMDAFVQGLQIVGIMTIAVWLVFFWSVISSGGGRRTQTCDVHSGACPVCGARDHCLHRGLSRDGDDRE